jgi:hypothetical protein
MPGLFNICSFGVIERYLELSSSSSLTEDFDLTAVDLATVDLAAVDLAAVDLAAVDLVVVFLDVDVTALVKGTADSTSLLSSAADAIMSFCCDTAIY